MSDIPRSARLAPRIIPIMNVKAASSSFSASRTSEAATQPELAEDLWEQI